ncbi:hypothetical protein ACIP5Y_03765 [Nocardia sp. NPDC088792]|uniref:hypothetical protein n=1 Tax=Nocardia sp. NPDC088792 TaxID=3364332 RepID=UPI003801856C
MSSDHPNGAPGDAPNTPHPGEAAYPHEPTTPPARPRPGEPTPAEDDSTTPGRPAPGDAQGSPQPTTPFGWEPSTPAGQFGGPQLTNPFADESPKAGGYQPTLAYPGGAEPDLPGGAAPHGEPHHLGVPPLGYPPAFEMPVPAVESANPMPGVEDAPPRRGKIEVQEAGVTRPRPPTVAEARAREKARKRAEAQALAEAEAAETKRRNRKKLLIGGGAIVGVAALVGAGYLAYDAWNGPEVTAYCTVVAKQGEQVPIGNGQTVTATSDNQEIVVPDNYCSDAENRGSGINPGFFFLAGHSYRYYYGGTGSIGHAPTGGSITAPSGATVKTKSGSTIQRGGLGARLHGGS